jgi:hypothetical protein
VRKALKGILKRLTEALQKKRPRKDYLEKQAEFGNGAGC